MTSISWAVIGVQLIVNIVAIAFVLQNKQDARRAKQREIEMRQARRYLEPEFEFGETPTFSYSTDTRVTNCMHVPVFSEDFEITHKKSGAVWNWVCAKCGTEGVCRFRYWPPQVGESKYLETIATVGHGLTRRKAARDRLLALHPGHPLERKSS